MPQTVHLRYDLAPAFESKSAVAGGVRSGVRQNWVRLGERERRDRFGARRKKVLRVFDCSSSCGLMRLRLISLLGAGGINCGGGALHDQSAQAHDGTQRFGSAQLEGKSMCSADFTSYCFSRSTGLKPTGLNPEEK
jgi:hypothetical protein